MAQTFYFYDLETTGFNPRLGRIMQFAGHRTDMNLKPTGQADNMLIKITEDVLPDPGAILITGITPQKTLSEGLGETDFVRYFDQKINLPNTIFLGFNSIRFDDEFMRHLFYRNFYDPYEWQWQDGRSRWDLLDVSRMMRALRPDGIKWPFASDGSPSNQLGLLTAINKLQHLNAHDALSDVMATISLAELIKRKQPKLFDFLLKLRDKRKIAALVGGGQPFIYSSGKYPSEYEKTTIALALADHPKRSGAFVYDLRHDPLPFAKFSPAQLAAAWQRRDLAEGPILPVKTLQFNRCPAVAPLSVLDKASQTRLKLDIKTINQNAKKLQNLKGWPERLVEALEIMDKKQQERLLVDEQEVDNQLYDGFFNGYDKQMMKEIRAAEPERLTALGAKLTDKRLKTMLGLYKARNFRSHLTPEEAHDWEQFRLKRLADGGQISRLSLYFNALDELGKQKSLTGEQKFILEELRLYGESLLPGA